MMALGNNPLPQVTLRSRARQALRRIGGRIEEPFHQQKAIFIHIPKAAGSAISAQVYGSQVGHLRLAELWAADPQSVEAYFTFTFVRDPLDRFVSAYRFLSGGGMNEKDARFAQKHIAGRSMVQVARALRKEPQLQRKVHFQPQSSFVTLPSEPDHIAVDFVGRFENIESDFAKIAGRLGIDANLPVRNATPASSTPASSKQVSQVDVSQVDGEVRAIVGELYSSDYALFGY